MINIIYNSIVNKYILYGLEAAQIIYAKWFIRTAIYQQHRSKVDKKLRDSNHADIIIGGDQE
ncbi:MAG: hypothetical protein J6Q61_00985 [Bacteroidales bacterium]|nr:hypothetical protein [Bacteroidales bacterium]